MTVILQEQDFKPDQVQKDHLITSDKTGATVCFTGLVRQDSDGSLQSMALEHYPAMTKRALERIEDEARNRFDLIDLVILHRYGKLLPGERIMMVATASAHRSEAFRAAEFLMDFLKTDAPFWKKEERSAGASWVRASKSDDAQRDRWSA